MTSLTLCPTVTFETTAVADAVALVATAHEALYKRHGLQFRALQRKIEALADNDGRSLIGEQVSLPSDVGNIWISLAAHPEIVAVIREARSLGVI